MCDLCICVVVFFCFFVCDVMVVLYRFLPLSFLHTRLCSIVDVTEYFCGFFVASCEFCGCGCWDAFCSVLTVA
jgi:hypothetical protein